MQFCRIYKFFYQFFKNPQKKYASTQKKYQFLKTSEFFMQFRKSTRIFAGFSFRESHKNQSILTVL